MSRRKHKEREQRNDKPCASPLSTIFSVFFSFVHGAHCSTYMRLTLSFELQAVSVNASRRSSQGLQMNKLNRERDFACAGLVRFDSLENSDPFAVLSVRWLRVEKTITITIQPRFPQSSQPAENRINRARHERGRREKKNLPLSSSRCLVPLARVTWPSFTWTPHGSPPQAAGYPCWSHRPC